MRAFIAIELPEEIKQALGQLQQKLKATGADAKWVAPENIHLTLKFLGEINDTQLAKINAILDETARQNNPFQLRINSIGVFPKMELRICEGDIRRSPDDTSGRRRMDSPKVIWVGVDKGDAESKKIVAQLEEKIAQIGIPKEKREFSSHITIARVRSSLNREKLIQGLNNSAGYFLNDNLQFNTAKITLFKSILTPKGPVYEVQAEASLRAS